MTTKELSGLIEAYQTVVVETRNLVALTQRMVMIIGSAKQDLQKLERAIHHAQDLERDAAANAPPGAA